MSAAFVRINNTVDSYGIAPYKKVSAERTP